MPRWGEHRTITNPDGSKTIMFFDYGGPRPKFKPCFVCGKASDYLCDWPVPGHKSGTCDRRLCQAHTQRPPATFGDPKSLDVDYCPYHFEMWEKLQEVKP